MDVGKLTYIKDGKIDCKYYYDSKEQGNLSIESIYQDAYKMVDEDYTVVINMKDEEEPTRYGYFQSEFIIPENIKNQDFIRIMKKMRDDFRNIENISIINYCNRHGYSDYDYYDYTLNMLELTDDMDSTERYYCQKSNKNRIPERILDLFLRKKLNGLTEREEKMYQLYEDFDIEKLLYYDNTNFELNNGNSGVITIFKDQTYKSTVTKMFHRDEHQQHINAYMSSNMGMEETDNIYIQLTSGYISCWLPSEINEYQKKQLNEFFKEIEDLQMLKGNIEVFGAVREENNISDIREEFNGIDSIKQHINQSNSKK